MEVSTVQSTTGNSLETSKAQEQQGTNPALTRVVRTVRVAVSVLNFTPVLLSSEKLNIGFVVGFVLSVLFALFQPT